MGHEGIAMVQPYGEGKLCISAEGAWFPVECFDDDLRYCDSTVIRVYGYASPMNARTTKLYDRELLWTREDEVDMTIAEIERRLGFRVNIVGEHDESLLFR